MKTKFNWQTTREGFKILKVIAMASFLTSQGRISTKELMKSTGQNKTTISNYIDLFRTEGIIKEEREGKTKSYYLDVNKISSLINRKAEMQEITPLINISENFEEFAKRAKTNKIQRGKETFEKFLYKFKPEKYPAMKKPKHTGMFPLSKDMRGKMGITGIDFPQLYEEMYACGYEQAYYELQEVIDELKKENARLNKNMQ